MNNSKTTLLKDENTLIKGHGGSRSGAGRPKQEVTVVRRVPLGILQQVENTIARYKGALPDDTMFLASLT